MGILKISGLASVKLLVIIDLFLEGKVFLLELLDRSSLLFNELSILDQFGFFNGDSRGFAGNSDLLQHDDGVVLFFDLLFEFDDLLKVLFQTKLGFMLHLLKLLIVAKFKVKVVLERHYLLLIGTGFIFESLVVLGGLVQ